MVKVYESLVVNEYLAEVFPDASPLLPKSPVGRAKARIITSRSNDLTTAYFTYLTNKNEVNSDAQMRACVTPDAMPCVILLVVRLRNGRSHPCQAGQGLVFGSLVRGLA